MKSVRMRTVSVSLNVKLYSAEMEFWISICFICLMQLFGFCDASKHSCGQMYDYGMTMVYRRTLIRDINKVVKNYTINYKYLGAESKEIAYLEFDINVKSEGYVNAYDRKKVIEAQIHIKNALNVIATLEIYRFGIIDMPQFNWMRNDDAKSITFIHKQNANPSKIKRFAQNAIGRRREGDTLLHFESRNITNCSRFPSRAFQYSGTDQYITYVGFSFNSPTAMVMINTSFVDEQEFNAVAYDMNTEHFVANMSVYGIESPARRPFEFEGVI